MNRFFTSFLIVGFLSVLLGGVSMMDSHDNCLFGKLVNCAGNPIAMVNAHYTAFQNLGAAVFSSLAFAFVVLYFAFGAVWRLRTKNADPLFLKTHLTRLEDSYLAFKKSFYIWLALLEHSSFFA